MYGAIQGSIRNCKEYTGLRVLSFWGLGLRVDNFISRINNEMEISLIWAFKAL